MGVLPGLPGGALVLPRSLVLFSRFSMDGIPPRQRREALVLELEQRAPFDAPAGWVVWHGSVACVWYWSATEQVPANASAEVPETALWPSLAPGQERWIQSSEQGLNLLQFCHPRNGLFEKRYTRPISADEASAWLLRHGADASAASQARPVDLPPPSKPVGESLNAVPSSLEARVLPGASVVLALLAIMYTVAIGRAWWEVEQTAEAVNAMRGSAQNVIELRNRAVELQGELQSLTAQTQASQIGLAATLAEALALENAELIRWNYRNGRLEVTWENATAPPEATTIIRELESRPEFGNVQAQVLSDKAVEVILSLEGVAP